MPVAFESLMVGEEYDRPQLAEHWGYQSHHAISRGVITPSGTRYIVLFVTKEKQETLTQYQDFIEDNVLHWEGEEKHRSDDRIIYAQLNGEEIHLFYRDRHHSPFVYLGPIILIDSERRADAPSRFVFRIDALAETQYSDPFEDIEKHEREFRALDETERKAIVQSRIGQGQFRANVLDLWGGCAVTGVTDHRVLKASHVKPWSKGSNEERLDPHNGLALTPSLDALFDYGLITFDAEGWIRLSGHIDVATLSTMGIRDNMQLRMMPERLERYLQYHRRFVFKEPWNIE